MKSITTYISIDNKALTPFLGRHYSQKYTQVTFGELKGNLKKALSLLYKAFNVADSMPEDDQVAFTVASESGAFKRFYGPALAKKDDSVILAFNDINFPLSNFGVDPEAVETSMEIAEIKLNGYDEVCLKINMYIVASEVLLTYYVPVMLTKEANEDKNVTVDSLNLMLKRSPEKLVPLLREPVGSGSNNETISAGMLMSGETYTVIGYRSVNAGGRETFLVTIEGDGQQTYQVGNDPDDREVISTLDVWAPSAVKTFLVDGPEITVDKPAQLVVRKIKKVSRGYSVDAGIICESSVVIEDEEFDFGF